MPLYLENLESVLNFKSGLEILKNFKSSRKTWKKPRKFCSLKILLFTVDILR